MLATHDPYLCKCTPVTQAHGRWKHEDPKFRVILGIQLTQGHLGPHEAVLMRKRMVTRRRRLGLDSISSVSWTPGRAWDP